MALVLLLWFRREWRNRTLSLVLIITAIILSVILLLRFGFMNDLALKAFIAPLFLLELLVLVAWVRGNRATRVMLSAYLVLAALSGASSLLFFAYHDVARDIEGRGQFALDLSCQHNRYVHVVGLNYIAQYLGAYEGDRLGTGLLQEPRGDLHLDLRPSPSCAAALRAAAGP